MGPIVTIIILGILLVLSGFFSSTETAYSCANRIKLRSLSTNGNKRAGKVLKLAEDDGVLFNVSEELPRTFVIEASEKGKIKVYLSPVSSATLLKRAEETGIE